MSIVYFSNRRLTSRNKLTINGKLSIGEYTEAIIINDISLNGIQIVFSNNTLFYEYLKYSYDNKNIIVSLDYYQYSINIKCSIEWLKIYDVGEKSFYVLSGLNYEKDDFNKIKSEITNLILDINMNKVYISKLNTKDESLLG